MSVCVDTYSLIVFKFYKTADLFLVRKYKTSDVFFEGVNRPNGQIQVDIHNEENLNRSKRNGTENESAKIVPTTPRTERKEKKEKDDDEKSLEWVSFLSFFFSF